MLSKMSDWRCSSCSACLRAVMSITVPVTRAGTPSASHSTSPLQQIHRQPLPCGSMRYSTSTCVFFSSARPSAWRTRGRSAGCTTSARSMARPDSLPTARPSRRSTCSLHVTWPVCAFQSQMPTRAADSAWRSCSSRCSSISRLEKRNTVTVPIWSRSPSCSSALVTGVPLSSVPLVDSRSVTWQVPSGARTMRACLRDTPWSSMRTVASEPRPMMCSPGSSRNALPMAAGVVVLMRMRHALVEDGGARVRPAHVVRSSNGVVMYLPPGAPVRSPSPQTIPVSVRGVTIRESSSPGPRSPITQGGVGGQSIRQVTPVPLACPPS
jgi:hypothetical protein